MLGGSDPSSVSSEDFVLPREHSMDAYPCITFTSMDLTKSKPLHDQVESSPTDLYHASMTFQHISTQGMSQPITIRLKHDVLFATAHPCRASTHAHILSYNESQPSSMPTPTTGPSCSPNSFLPHQTSTNLYTHSSRPSPPQSIHLHAHPPLHHNPVPSVNDPR